MKISYLRLFISLLCLTPSSIAGEQEGEGTCNAADGGTCTSSDTDTETTGGTICFPDGNCFETMKEAEINYKKQNSRSAVIEMKAPVSLGDAQEVATENDQYYTKTLEVLTKTHDYMVDLFQNDTAKSYRNECKVRHELCGFWAAIGAYRIY